MAASVRSDGGQYLGQLILSEWFLGSSQCRVKMLLLGGPDQRGGAAGALDGVLVGQKAHIAATTLADLDDNGNLVHASVESSEQANVYSGTATLDENGEATVELPEWMGALNEDFRYQLTCLGQFAPVYIAEEVSENRFKIAGGSSRIRVCSQLTGLRKDAWAQAHPLRVEEDKSAEQRGHYRHPEMFGEGPNSSIFWAGNPDLMARLAAL